MKAGFTISALVLVFFLRSLNAQKPEWMLQDSLSFDAQEVYVDRLNQIYLMGMDRRNIVKLNENYSLNQEYSSPFISQYAFMDVRDPMKVLLFLPQFASVSMLDESFALLSDEYFAGFNNESAICFFSTNQLCFFSEGRMHLRNLQDRQVTSSEPVFYDRKVVADVSQIKANGREIYLMMPGYGIWRFNSFLNMETFLEDHQLRRMDLLEEQLYVLRGNSIEMSAKSFSAGDFSTVLRFDQAVQSFAVNRKYLLVAQKGRVLRYRRAS